VTRRSRRSATAPGRRRDGFPSIPSLWGTRFAGCSTASSRTDIAGSALNPKTGDSRWTSSRRRATSRRTPALTSPGWAWSSGV